MKIGLKKTVIISMLVILILILRFSTIGDLIDLQRVTESRTQIKLWVNETGFIAILTYILIYILTVALSIPGAAILTMTGGFLFGPYLAALYINLGATTGAIINFLVARYLIGKSFQQKYRSQLAKFNRELDCNGVNYLLSLRLIPVFPFFLINILAGLTNINFKTFIWTTAIGIIPVSFIYAYLGFAGGTMGESDSLLTNEILLALTLLGVLALLPVVVKKVRSRRNV